MNLKTMSLIMLSCFCLNVNAIPPAPCDKPVQNVCCDKPKPGPFAFKYPRDIGLVCPSNFYVAFDLLVMQAKENGLDYAMTNSSGGQNANTIGTSPLTNGSVKGYTTDDNGSWDLGGRFDIGYYSNHDFWNLDATWTYFHFTEDKSSSIDGSGRMLPFWLTPVDFPPAATAIPAGDASAQWKLHYNTLDLSLGIPRHSSRYFITNPFFGIRAAWIKQSYLARYGGDQGVNNPDVALASSPEMNAKNDLSAIGFRAGLNAEWLIGLGFQVFGNIAGSMLYTKFDVDQNVAQFGNGYEVSNDFTQNIPNLEAAFGLGYRALFNKNKASVVARVAWEFHQWWNVNQLRRFFDEQNWSANKPVSRGDLTLNGVSISLGFDL
ncbi:MAG: Lpg1974 family pore-forming outer membrane protein [Chlamydiota bacterium]|jgi:hypothetical protein